jgi:hypothetical protein
LTAQPDLGQSLKKPVPDSTARPAASSGPSRGGRTEPTAPQQPADDKDMHAWLNQRINDIRHERQGRWQKLFGSLMGLKLEEEIP